jgi:formate hydrogenlyase subunit 6/NADH:ubiquinone oxidoreductase subunit I
MRNAIAALVPTLSRFRYLVQVVMLFLSVWGSVVVGHYTAEKISTTLPALSCAYAKQHGSYCVLIPLQHQMHHRVGEALVKAQQITRDVIFPTLIALATFLAFYFVLGKAFCAWVCPLGTVQEWINKLGRRLGRPQHQLESGTGRRARPIKWVILLALVFLVPILAGAGVAPHSLGNPYCDVCPSRIVTTLLSANTEELALKTQDGVSMALSGFADILVGFMLIAALAMRQPFCRICPMLAMNAIFRHVSLTRLVKGKNEKCEKCGICTKACPMDIPEIHHEAGRKAFNEDCTLCGRCAEYCPDDGVIRIQFGPWALFSSSREYYKKRLKMETPEGIWKPVKFVRKAGATGNAG